MSTEAVAPPVDATEAAPAPAAPQPTVTSDWVPATTTPKPRAGRDRGMPVAPVLTAAGNAVAMAGTGAYEAAGLTGLAVAGVVVAGGTVAAVARRRSTVKRRMASTRSGGSRGGSGGSRGGLGSFGLGGGSRGAGRLGGGSRSGGGSRGGLRGATTTRSGGGSSLLSGGGSFRRNGGATGPARKGGLGGVTVAPQKKTKGAGRDGVGAARHRANRNHGKATRAAIAAARGVGRGARGLGRGVARAGGSFGRAMAASWQAIRPVRTGRTTTRATTRRRLRKAVGALWDGARAIASATGSRIWNPKNRDGRSWLARVRDAWTRRREARAAKAAAKAAEAAATTDTRTVAATVRRPAGVSVPATFGGATAMPGHHFTGPAMEMARGAAAYDPQGMLQVGMDFAGLKDALELVAEAMKISVDNADAKQPLAEPIIDHMRQIWQLQMRAAELAGELPAAFRNFHQVDIARLENPRKGPAGEAMWDVRANQY